MGKEFAPAYADIYMSNGRRLSSQNVKNNLLAIFATWMISGAFGITQKITWRSLLENLTHTTQQSTSRRQPVTQVREDDYNSATKILLMALRKRDYPRSLFRSALKEVLEPPTPSTLENSPPKIVPFFTIYSSFTARASRLAKYNFNCLMEGTQLGQQLKIILEYHS